MEKSKFTKAIAIFCAFLLFFRGGAEASATESSSIAEAQQSKKTVTGIVYDEYGEPLTGANVVEKGTTNGIITDIDGKFSLSVSENATLLVSYIGYASQELPVSGKTNFRIRMSGDTQALDEVVVTALGIKREEKALGYAFTKVAGEDLAQVNAVNVASALQGMSPGVQVDQIGASVVSSPRINIRGNSTFEGNNQPLFVIDGVVIDGGTSDGRTDWGNGFKNVNPADIESMNVLRGAAATALYGSQALNGVVVITTKTGAGAEGKGLNVDVSTNTSFGIINKPFDFQDEYGAGLYAGANSQLSNKFYTTQEFRKNGDDRDIIAPITLNWGPRMEGQSVIDYVGDEVKYVPYPDNWKALYENSYTTTNNVALSKSTENMNLRLAYTRMDAKGIYARNDFEKNTFNLNMSYQFNKYISASVKATYVNSHHENPTYQHGDQNYAFSRLLGWFGLTRSYDIEKFAQPKYYISSVYDEWPQPPRDPADPGYNIPRINQIYYYYHWKDQFEDEDNLIGSISLDVTPTDWSTITVGARTNIRDRYRETHQWYDYGDGSTRFMKDEYSNDYVSYFAKLHLTQKILNEDLQLDFITQAESQEWVNNQINGFATSHTAPGEWFFGNFPNGTNKRVSGNWSNTKVLNSISGILDLSYKNQLFMSLTARNDWSSTLVYTDGSGQPSFFYPSVSVSWLPHETFELPEYVSFAKLRASYGETGGSPNPYSINFAYNASQLDNMDVSYMQYDKNFLPNPNIKPFKQREFEVGLDTRFLNNRIGFDLALYKRNTFNQIINLPVSVASGVNDTQINAGDIQNQGIELAIDAVPVRTGDFEWSINANYSKNRNTIKELYGNLTRNDLSKGRNVYTGANAYAFVGGDYGVITANAVPRVYLNPDDPNDPNNGKYVVNWNDDYGTISYTSSGTQFKAGKIEPDFVGSLNNKFSWKGLSLDVQLYFKIGGDVALSSYGTGMLYAGTGQSSLAYRDASKGGIVFTTPEGVQGGGTFEDGYIPDNIVFAEGQTAYGKDIGGMDYKEAIEKGLVYPSHISSYYWANHAGGAYSGADIFENSYITLKNIALSYSLPRKVCNQMKLQNMSLSLYARDIAVLYNTLPDNANPQFLYSSNSGAFTDGDGISPWASTVGFSLNIGF